MAKNWLDAYYEDQKKKQQEKANGQVRFKEESTKSRLQYSNPNYTGNSEKGNYKWETETLKDVKMPKGMGKSYNDKFNYLTSQMGMSEGQAQDFRRYMDFQEDQQKSKYRKQKYEFKKDKDGNLVEVGSGTPDEAWKLDRKSYNDGTGLNLKSDIIDGILNGMTNRAEQGVRSANERAQAEKVKKETEKAAKQQMVKNQPKNGLDKVMDVINSPLKLADEHVLRPLERLATNFTDGLALGQLKKNIDKSPLGAPEFVKQASEAPTNTAEKVIDVTGEMAGSFAPIGLAYKGVSPIAKAITGNKFGQAAIRGGMAGGVFSGAQQGIDEITNPDDATAKERALNVLLGAGIGAVADPALLGLGVAGQNVLGRFAKTDGALPTFSGQASDEVLNALAPKQANNVKSSNALYDQLINPKAPETPVSAATSPKVSQALDELANFAQQGTPKARGAVEKITNPARYAKEDLGALADDLLSGKQKPNPNTGANQRLLEVQNEMRTQVDRLAMYGKQITPDEAYLKVRKESDPATFDELISSATKEADQQAYDNSLEGLLRNDPKIAEALKGLNDLGRSDAQTQTALKTPDEIIAELTNKPKPKEIVNNSQEPTKVTDDLISKHLNPDGSFKQFSSQELNSMPIEERLNFQRERQRIMKSQNGTPDKVKLSIDELNRLVRGEKSSPKSETNVTSEEKSKLLLGGNLQQFNSDAAPIISSEKPIDTVSAIGNIKNPVIRGLKKHYEAYVNKTHGAKVAHTQVLENAIKKAEADGLPKKAEMLKAELKNVKKHGSDVEKSIQNIQAGAARAQYFLESHITKLQDALGSTKPEDMANAIRYQVARNIDWIWKNVNAEYKIPGWDRGTVNTIMNEGVGNTKLQDFSKAMRGLTQERLDLALKYNLINKEAHTALSKNPEYIPMARDVTQGMDNVARGLKGGTASNKSKSGAYFIQSLGQGDAEALLKDPMETLMSGTFSLFKNMAKADSERQLYNMAKLDHDHLFSRIVTKKEFDANGGIAVPTPKGTKYIQVQDDLMKMVKEQELPYDLNVIGKITSAFAGAKTRSLEYHMTGAPRDIMEGYLKGQTNNPITYLKELVKAAKEHNITAKEAGAHFNKAYKDGMNGINPEKMMKEYARQNKIIKPFNLTSKEGRKETIRNIGRILDMPFAPIKKIGQLSDELPRTVEIKATEKAFMKEHGAKIENIKTYLNQVNARLDAVKDVKDPFDPRLKGVEKLQGQKTKLENMLNEYDKALQRETTFRGRDLMNFGNSGRSGVAKHIRQYFIFANTTTQSKDKLVRSFVERPVETLAKTALLTAPLVYAEQVLHQNLTGKDKEIYDNLPYWIKQYNYTYVMNGNVYTIPKIQELALLTNPIEAILSGNKEDLNDTAKLAVKETVPYQIGNFAQGLVPNADGSLTILDNMQMPGGIWSPISDAKANQKMGFNGNPISYADYYHKEDPKANKFTTDIAKKIFGDKARADYAQYLGTQYPGDAGKYGTFTLDWLFDPKNSDKLDAMIKNLNPLQDRVYKSDSRVFKNPPKKTTTDK